MFSRVYFGKVSRKLFSFYCSELVESRRQDCFMSYAKEIRDYRGGNHAPGRTPNGQSTRWAGWIYCMQYERILRRSFGFLIFQLYLTPYQLTSVTHCTALASLPIHCRVSNLQRLWYSFTLVYSHVFLTKEYRFLLAYFLWIAMIFRNWKSPSNGYFDDPD